MRWIVQQNLAIENQRFALMEALDRLGADWTAVTLKPGLVLDPAIPENDAPIITNGSVALTRLAYTQGWTPGGFWSDDFNYAFWGVPTHPWHSLLLNRDGQKGTLGDIKIPEKGAFGRPLSDTKAFNGQIHTPKTLEALQEAARAGKLDPLTPVLSCPIRTIGQEHRHYIVDGNIITSSRYKLSGQPNFRRGADEAVLDVVRHAVSQWQPARAFVLDTFIAGDDIGIVETGCIGNAGLYEADLLALVHAMDSMAFPENSRDTLLNQDQNTHPRVLG